MFSQALRDIARPSYAEILEALKRSDGMAVSELAKELKMSYMGVKQHCVNLEKKGYLKTWRVPRTQVGRPEKLYRLTKECEELFPQTGPSLTLDLLQGVKKFYGDAAPEKMLLHHYEEQGKRWAEEMRGCNSLPEKAIRLAELRDSTGCFSRCKYDSQSGLRLEEYHHTMTPIFDVYPNAIRMELQMMEQLLGTRVTRTVAEGIKGRRHIVYELASLGAPNVEREAAPAATPQPVERTTALNNVGSSSQAPSILEM